LTHYLAEEKTFYTIQDNTYKFYQNRPGFVDDVTKHFGVLFDSQCIVLAGYQIPTASSREILKPCT